MSPLVRRIFFGIGVAILVVAAIGVAVWIGLNKRYKAPSPLRCLPTSTSLVVRLADRAALAEMASSSEYGDEITHVVGGDFVWKMAERIDSLFGYADVLSRPTLKNRDLFISYEKNGKGKPKNVTASFCLNNRLEWHKAMYILGQQAGVTVRDTTVNGHGLYALWQDGFSSPLFMAAGGGCLFASESPDVPLAFGDDNVTFMRDDASFSTIERAVTSSSPISIYANCKNIGPLAKDTLSAATEQIFARALNVAGTGSDWMAMDLGLHSEGLSADGFTISLHPSLEMIMTRDAPSELDVVRRIPAGVRHFTRYAPGARGLSSEAFSEYVNNSVEVRAYRDRQSDLFRQTGVDVEALLADVFASEIAICSYSADGKSDRFIVVDSHGGTMAQATLTQALTALHGGVSPIVIGEISPGAAAVPAGAISGKQVSVNVGEMSIPVYDAFRDVDCLFFLNYLFGFDLPHKYFFRFEDVIVFADETSLLRRVLVDYVQGHTLAGDQDFIKLRSYFSSDCIKFSYDKPQRESVFGTVGMQITVAGRLPYTSICALVAGEAPREVETAKWKVRVDSESTDKLFAVVNHYTHDVECLVQDSKGDLNLVGADGMILWKRNVDPIVGNVCQVDFFGNGKLQYLFASEKKLYIVDRLGNDVRGFPVNLKSDAIGGASFVAYADKSPMRFLVPSESGMMLYGPDGKVVDGWNMIRPEGKLSDRTSHFVCNKKDYLIARDQYAYYITDRRGNRRFATDPVGPGLESDMVMRESTESSFVTTAADGSMISINASDGKISQLRVDSIGVNHIGRSVDGNIFALANAKRLVLVDVQEFAVDKVVNMDLKSLDQLETDGVILAVYDSADHIVRLFTSAGDEISGSPLPAYGPVAIGRGPLGTTIFTTSEAGEIVCFSVE